MRKFLNWLMKPPKHMEEVYRQNLQPPKPTATDKIVEALRTGKLIKGEFGDTGINSHSISDMRVMVDDKIEVYVSWYSGVDNSPRTIAIDGDRSIPKGPDVDRIFAAAIWRANQLTQENLDKLDAKLGIEKE